MRTVTLVLLAVALVAFTAPPVTAQPPAPARSINPEAVEFDTPELSRPGITGYVVELFVAFADTQQDVPVTTKALGRDALQGGIVRVDVKDLALDVPDGRYVATIRPQPSAVSDRSAPSDPFLLKREGTPEDRVAEARRERFWTKVGIALGASLLLLPLLF